MESSEVSEEPDASVSVEEELINETVTNNDDCTPETSEEIVPLPHSTEARSRTLSATYTFPDPEEPSRNLVLEFPLSAPQKDSPPTTAGSDTYDVDMKTPAEEAPQANEDVVFMESMEKSTPIAAEFAGEPMDVTVDPSINQPKEPNNESATLSSPWLSYVQQRIHQCGYAMQRSLLDRQRMLLQFVGDDHAYGQLRDPAGEAVSNSSVMHSKKTLFFADFALNCVHGGDWTTSESDELIIDVVSDDPAVLREEMPSLPYSRQKALVAMSEMERFMYQIRGVPEMEMIVGKDGKCEDDLLVKTYTKRGTWTPRQRSFFDSCVKILQSERHVRLASAGLLDEPIIRRLSVDKAAARFRRLMASVEWSGRLVYWLHAVLVDGLNSQMLAIYFEILQTLKPKIAELVNSLVNYMLPAVTVPGESVEGLIPLLDNPWDPVGKSVFRFDKTIKLPKNPMIVIAPHPYAQGQENVAHSRIHSIVKFLMRLGTVVQVDCGPTDTLTPSDLYKNMLISTRDTLIDLRKIHTERPFVMVGLGIGSMVACQASLLEPCAAIVCFGFPLKTPRGIHGDYGDPLLKLDAAVQFIVGMDAANCPHAEFHDFWDKLTCDTEVVWAAGCDDYLRMNHASKMSLKMTQSMVDRCFLEKMVQFLQQALLKDPVRRIETTAPEVTKKRKAKATSSTPRAPSKKAKTESRSPDTSEKSSKKVELLSESTMSSQEMSNGGSQSSSDTLPAELFPPTEPSTPDPSCSPIRTMEPTPLAVPPSTDLPHPPNEQSTLSIHFTTTQLLADQRRHRPDGLEAHRRYFDNANRTFWTSQSPMVISDGRVGGMRPGLPRVSVIAHTGARMPGGAAATTSGAAEGPSSSSAVPK